MAYNKVEICGVDTSKLIVLTEKEKRALLLRVKEGDKQAREELVNGNLRLILSVIQRFTNRGENPDDLFQVGCIGLIKSIDNFDINQPVRFSTYAVPMNVPWGKRKGSPDMTRKQAISLIVEYISKQQSLPEKVCKAVNKLQEIQGDIPFTGWSEKTIRDTLDQFVVDNGRQPTATDLKKKGMPPHPVMKLRFGVNASEWLQLNYPRNEVNWRWDYTQKHGEKSSADWKQLFSEEYKRIKPKTALEYNRRRNPVLPSWQVVAKFLGATTWTNLKSKCGIVEVFERAGEISVSVNTHITFMGIEQKV